VRHDLDEKEKQQAVALLDDSDPRNPIVVALRQLLTEAQPLADRPPSLPERLARWAHDRYLALVSHRWFSVALIVLFCLLGLADIATVVNIVVSDPDFRLGHPDLSFVDWADMLSSVIFAGLIVVGAFQLPRSRVSAYRWFRRAMLVSIFFSQVFAFYTEQFWAVLGLAVDLLLLAALNYTIAEEKEHHHLAAEPEPSLSATLDPLEA